MFILGVKSPPWIFGGLREDESHFIGMVWWWGLLSTGEPRGEGIGNGCVHISNLPLQLLHPADGSGPFYHICSLYSI